MQIVRNGDESFCWNRVVVFFFLLSMLVIFLSEGDVVCTAVGCVFRVSF